MRRCTPCIITLFITFTILSNEISIESIIRKPEINSVSLSMDGKYVAAIYIDSNDIQHLITKNLETGQKNTLKMIEDKDIYWYCWASNNHLIYKTSYEDGKYHSYTGVINRDLKISSKRVLLWSGVQTSVIDGLLNDPDNILIKKRYQIHYSYIGRMNIHNGRIRKKDKFRDEVRWCMTDFNDILRLVSLYDYKNEGAKSDHLYRSSSEAPWEKIPLCKEDYIYSFTPDGRGLYVGSYKNPSDDYRCDESTFNKQLQDSSREKMQNSMQSTMSLYIYDIEKGNFQQTVFSDSVFDFHGALHFFSNPYNPAATNLKGLTLWNDTIVTIWYDKRIETIQHTLDSCFPHSVNYIYDADTSLNRFLVNSYSDIKESDYYLYDANDGKVTLLFNSCPWLKSELMCKTKPVTFQTRDSLMLHAYLTLPNTGKPPYPTVIFSHGGPHARDYWGFNSQVQVVASRGYAVFQINYRGSTGFGYVISEKEKYNFHKMYLDIIDGTRFLIKEGIADEDKIAIMGASFGGYLTLCGITVEPDLYCCAVSKVGVYDYRKHLNTTRFNNKYKYDYYFSYLGGGKNKKYLDSISPIHKIKSIKVPVFIAGGDEDQRVLSSQSYEMADKLKAAGIQVETFIKAGEGHGFFRQKNITEYYRRVLDFLSRNMNDSKKE